MTQTVKKIAYKAETYNVYSSLINDPKETFIIKVTGNSMINAGINSGDYLLVDRTIEPENGKIVIASINNNLIVKKIYFTKDITYLLSENKNYEPIEVSSEDKLDIWGVVTSVIKSLE